MSGRQDATGPGAPAARPPRGRRATALLRWRRRGWADDRELAHAIHGTVVGAAAMGAASLHGSLGQVVTTVLVTIVVYWAAERYARLLAAAVQEPRGGGRVRAALVVLRHGWPMVEAAYTPLVVLVVVVAATRDLRTGVLTALGVATLELGTLGYVAARRAGTDRAAALGWAALSAGFGGVVIALKLALH